MAKKINAKKTVSVASSHVAMLSHPVEVTDLIVEALAAVTASAAA